MKIHGYVVLEKKRGRDRKDEFIGLRLVFGADIPDRGILCHDDGSGITFFDNHLNATNAIFRTNHHKLAFENNGPPIIVNCFIASVTSDLGNLDLGDGE